MNNDNTSVYVLWKGQRTGPHPLIEVRRMIATNRVSALHRLEINGRVVTVRELLESERPAPPEPVPPAPESPQKLGLKKSSFTGQSSDNQNMTSDGLNYQNIDSNDHFIHQAQQTNPGFLTKTFQDLIILKPFLTKPFNEFLGFEWAKDARAKVLLAVGMTPLILLYLFTSGVIPSDDDFLFGSVAGYISCLWACFFWKLFRAPDNNWIGCVLTYIFTISISIPVTFEILPLIPGMLTLNIEINSPQWSNLIWPMRFFTMWLGVAIPEEICKVSVVFFTAFLFRRTTSPHACMLLGLMSGLGFGMFEGVGYQMHENTNANTVGLYHLLNWLRLTTMPFLHAIWTGIAGYFIGLALQIPRLSYGLIAAAILVPSVFHSFHNIFGWLGLVMDGVAVTALLAYISYARENKLNGSF